MISNACKHVHDELSFIWCVLYSYFLRDDLEDAVRRSSSMYEHDFNFAPDFEELLLKLWGSGSQNDVIELAKRVLERFVLSTTNHIVLIAFLVNAEQLSINNASRLLQIPFYSEEELDDAISNVLEIAWLTNEDEEDGFMSPDADDVLFNALKEVRESVLFAN